MGSSVNDHSIDMETLGRALKNSIAMGLDDSATSRLAECVLNLFGYGDYLPDNRLTPAERNLMYYLEDEGFVTMRDEEVRLHDGKRWRLNYWVLKRDQIRRRASFPAIHGEEVDIYQILGEEAWVRTP